MPHEHLTAPMVERMKAPAAGQLDVFDRGYPGLALRLSYGGRKSWVWFYRWQGKQKRLGLGVYPETTLAEARDAWRAAREAVKAGKDPSTVPAVVQRSDTFGDVLDDWLARDQARNRSRRYVELGLKRVTLPKWKDRRIADITRREAIAVIDGIADRGKVTMARRTHAHLHRLFKWCVGREIIEVNPLAGVPKPGRETKPDRTLSDDELRLVWRAATSIGWPMGPVVQLLILTLQRREEIGALRWSEIDFDRNMIQFEGERVKNDTPHIVPLNAAARAIIDDLPRIAGSPFVFTLNGKSPVSSWAYTKTRIDTHVRDYAEAEAGRPVKIPGWRA